MRSQWSSHPSSESATRLAIQPIADAVCRWGMRLPVLVALEAGRPLSFIGAQSLWLAQPLLALFTAPDQVGRLAHILEDSQAVDALIHELASREIV